MARNRKIFFHSHTARTIGCGVQPLACWRRRDARGPDHRLAGDALAGNDDAVLVDFVHSLPEPYLDAQSLEPLLCLLERCSEKVPSTRLPRSTSTIRANVGSMRRNSDRRVLLTRTAMAPAISTRRPSAHQNKRQQVAVAAGVFLGFCLLERLENLVADRNLRRPGFSTLVQNFANSSCPK